MRRAHPIVSGSSECFGGMDLTPSELDRFNARIYHHADGCWEWLGELNNQGYGRFVTYPSGGRKRFLAHRLAYELATGEDIGGKILMHSCDTPSCCNPAHLTPGTQLDNMRDAMAKGRINLAGLEIGQRMSTREARSLRRRAA